MASDGGNANNSPREEYQQPSSGKEIDTIVIPEQTFWETVFSWRSFTIFLLQLSYILMAIPLATMSISLVCMCGPVKGPTIATQNSSSVSFESPYTEFDPLDNTTSKEKVYEFNWDPETRGLLISGYLFTAFLGPQLTNVVRGYIGNKMTLSLVSVLMALICFVSPIAARTNVYFFLAFRILSGLFIQSNIPISIDTMAWWIPAKEKLTSSTIIISGWAVGTSLGSVVAGFFCTIGIDNGWPLQFYFNGVLFVVWTIVWYFLSSRKPENHPYISEKEKAYIVAYRVGMNQAATKGTNDTPYRTILTSTPVLAFVARTSLHMWATIVILTCLPLYLTSVLQFSLPQAGSVASVVSIIRLPVGFMWSALGNFLLRRKNMTTNKARKICCSLGQGFGAALLFGISFMGESHKWIATVMLGASIMCVNFGLTMTTVIPLDMAPRYAGLISGISMTVTNVITITAPLAATAITQQGTFEQWRVVWIVMALVNLSAGLVFLIFGSASIQSWANPKAAPLL